MAADKDSALPLYILVDDYHSKANLPNTSKIPYWTIDLMDRVTSKAPLFDDLTTIISDIKWSLKDGEVERFDVFYKADADGEAMNEAYARKKLSYAEDLFKKLRNAMLYCNDLLKAGVEKPSADKTASDECSERLDASVTEEQVLSAKLKRKYKDK